MPQSHAQLEPPDTDTRAIDPLDNRLLKSLPPESYARIRDSIEVVDLPAKTVLWEAGETITNVYFPLDCVLSLIVPLARNHSVEAATIGNEGMAGIPIVHGTYRTALTLVAQVSGRAVRLPAAALRRVMNDEAIATLLLRYAAAFYDQTAQAVACNARHTLDQRCAKWLLLTHDRVGETTFSLTQEFLATMLGVRRPGVTVAASALQRTGVIRYWRGNVTVLDRQALEEKSCECYRANTDGFAALMRDCVTS